MAALTLSACLAASTPAKLEEASKEKAQLSERRRECSALLKTSRTQPPPQVARGLPRRIAVLLRGGGFRDSVAQHNDNSCCGASVYAQQRIAEYHNKELFPLLESNGTKVDVFIATYHCTNGRQYATSLLPGWYGTRLTALFVTDMASSDQRATTARGIGAIAHIQRNMRLEYDLVLSLRLDMEYSRVVRNCLLERNTPADYLGAGGDGNKDNFQFIPRGFFGCFALLVEDCAVPTPDTGAENPGGLPRPDPWLRRAHAEQECFSMLYHEGMNNLLKQVDEPPDASVGTPGCHQKGGAGSKIAGNYNHFRGWNLSDTSCWCHASLAYPSSGNPSLELMIHRMEEFGKAGACDVEFNRTRVSVRPVLNASSGKEVPHVTVSPILPSLPNKRGRRRLADVALWWS